MKRTVANGNYAPLKTLSLTRTRIKAFTPPAAWQIVVLKSLL